MPSLMKELMLALNVTHLALMWSFGKRNGRAFEEVDKSFVQLQLRSSLDPSYYLLVYPCSS